MPAEVVSIHYVRSDGARAVKADAVEVRANYGIPEDYRSGQSPRRQLTLIEEEALQEAARLLGRPVPEGASRRQVVVRGIDLNKMIGHHIRLGEITLSVERYCAPCERMNQELGPGGRDALRWKAGVTARVVSGGTLRVGDPVTLLPDSD
ncbi:MAG TPA: MOSC domain-containing protein [bacterium]|nr:MOSC domain-containing protein [bacterium]